MLQFSGRDAKSPFEIMRVFTEAGGNAKKSLVGHIESIFCLLIYN